MGEIRDEATAKMALRAAMTGHRVFTTLHTNDALGVIHRLEDLGLKKSMIAENLTGVLAQRLVRKICTNCKGTSENGCSDCLNTGYKGRIALAEILSLNDKMSDLIASSASRRKILTQAQVDGFKPMAQHGVCLLKEDVTTVKELSRFVFIDS